MKLYTYNKSSCKNTYNISVLCLALPMERHSCLKVIGFAAWSVYDIALSVDDIIVGTLHIIESALDIVYGGYDIILGTMIII